SPNPLWPRLQKKSLSSRYNPNRNNQLWRKPRPQQKKNPCGSAESVPVSSERRSHQERAPRPQPNAPAKKPRHRKKNRSRKERGRNHRKNKRRKFQVRPVNSFLAPFVVPFPTSFHSSHVSRSYSHLPHTIRAALE